MLLPGPSALLVTLDQLAKAWAIQHLASGQIRPLLPGSAAVAAGHQHRRRLQPLHRPRRALGLISALVSLAVMLWLLLRPPQGLLAAAGRRLAAGRGHRQRHRSLAAGRRGGFPGIHADLLPDLQPGRCGHQSGRGLLPARSPGSSPRCWSGARGTSPMLRELERRLTASSPGRTTPCWRIHMAGDGPRFQVSCRAVCYRIGRDRPQRRGH